MIDILVIQKIIEPQSVNNKHNDLHFGLEPFGVVLGEEIILAYVFKLELGEEQGPKHSENAKKGEEHGA